MKELPYFKFSPIEYSDADISFLSYAHQGLFIKICCMFWSRDCRSIPEGMLKQRFIDAQDLVEQLIMSGILKVDDDGVFVSFLREQFNKLIDSHKSKVEAGRKGGLSSAKARLKRCSSNPQAIKDKIRIDKDTNTLSWRNDLNIYLEECRDAYSRFWDDKEEVAKQEELNPNVNILKSIDKGYHNFWHTEAGWEYKKKSRNKNINWRSTIVNSISMNKVYYTREELAERNAQ